MKNLVAFPLFAVALSLQVAIISRIPLLMGTADLLLVVVVCWALQEQVETAWHWALLGGLMVGVVSALPLPTFPLAYFLAAAFARFILRQIWQSPILALLTVTFFSSLLVHLVSYLALFATGLVLPFEDVLALITLPGVMMNLLLALVVHPIIRDLAFWVYPVEDMA